jgi:antitoxin component YwqK of YwqJK toxin-antitoxin module
VGANFEKAAYTFIRDLPTSEITYKNGKLDRLSTDWHENERIDKEVTCKDGKIISSRHKKDQNKLL